MADHEKALRLFREVGDSQGASICTNNLGWLALIQADYEQATALLEENVRTSRGLDHKAGMHFSLLGLAGVAARREQPARAARLWGAAETMRETFGIRLPPMGRRHLDYEGDVATVRSQLGEAAFEAAWDEGKAMTQEEAVKFALGSTGPAHPEVLARSNSTSTFGSDASLDLKRAEALNGAGFLAFMQGEYGVAEGLVEEALALFRELGDKEGIASSLIHLGLARVLAEQSLETVPALIEKVMRLRSEIEDRHTVAMMLFVSGVMAVVEGDWERAVADHEEALTLFREIRDMRGTSMCITDLGLIALIRADYDRAAALLEENLRMSREPGHKPGIHYSLIGLAGVAARRGQPARAAKLWSAAEAIRETSGVSLNPLARRQLDYDGDVTAVRSRLGGTAFAAAWAEGKAMTQEQATGYALETAEPSPPEATVEETPPGRPAYRLTRREREVAALVARQMSNRQVASEFSISERTVETHVCNVLKKLGLKSRFRLAERWQGGGQS